MMPTWLLGKAKPGGVGNELQAGSLARVSLWAGVGGSGTPFLITPFHLLHRPGPALQSVFLFNP